MYIRQSVLGCWFNLGVIMEYFITILFGVICVFIGAVAHERDLARNFKRTGDAKAWFVDIKRSRGNHE